MQKHFNEFTDQYHTKRKLTHPVTVMRHGNVSLQRDDTEGFWLVTMNNSKYIYKSSTWAKMKYRRLLLVVGIVDEINPFDETYEKIEAMC